MIRKVVHTGTLHTASVPRTACSGEGLFLAEGIAHKAQSQQWAARRSPATQGLTGSATFMLGMGEGGFPPATKENKNKTTKSHQTP